MNNTLHPVALNQGISDEFDAEVSEIVFAIRIDEPEVIDVEISRIDGVFPATVTVFDADGNEVASASELVQLDERTYRILNDVELNEVGRYTVVATRTDGQSDEFDFRLNVRRDSGEEVAITDSDSVSSIEDLAASGNAAIGLDVGNRAPNFEVETIEGETVALHDLRGQVVLINFWGTWCGPCIREMPDLQEVYTENVDEGFTILALATRGDTREDVVEFRDDFDLTFPLIVDEGDVISDEYGIINLPSTFIVDPNGVIVFRHFGPVIEAQIIDVLDGLLDS